MTAYDAAAPDKAAELRRRIAGTLPEGWADALPTFEADAKGMASRAASGKVLDAIAAVLPELVGGSADLTPSVKTKATGMEDIQATTFGNRYLHYGIREHAMAAAMNGMALHGGVRPYGGTFLIFSDYSKPAIRLGALMGAPVVHVFTHDSVGLGEDGPTHQPVEQLAGLRAIPGLDVIRPADANETAAAWRVALEGGRPTALALSRQNLPTLPTTAERATDGVARGGYIVADSDGEPEVLLIGAGAEVGLLMEAKETLGGGARVISMPCQRRFFEQDASYRESVLPSAVRARVAAEAASPVGWHRLVGLDGETVTIDRFGTSAPGTEALTDLGMTADAVVAAARRVMG